jgi:D-alanyl-D-alanine carboxypeptidase (penicillin-binding protein 5/6)
VVAVVAVVVGSVAAVRINRPLAPPTLHSALPSSVVVPGSSPALPWPVLGQGAVSVPALGYASQSGPEAPVPIASLTKMANAIVILRDHPVAPGASGPMITITPGDVSQYDFDLANDESNIPILAGEMLSERQMLEALLTQSANDIAYSLAVWDAGSEAAFVAKMNALAVSLGATHTHYVDSSGYLPQSMSTAADCLRIAAAGMNIPTFAEVVGMSSVSLPLVGTARNIVTEIGNNGVIGVKSGYTSEAMGCMVLAAMATVEGRSVLVLADALGQQVPPPVAPKPTPAAPKSSSPTTAPPTTAPPTTTPPTTTPPTTTPPTTAPPTTTTTVPANDLEIQYPLLYTGPVVEKLLDASEKAIVPVVVATRHQPVAIAAVTWGGRTDRTQLLTSEGAWLLGWPGQRVVTGTRLDVVPPGAALGSHVGAAGFVLGSQLQLVPVELGGTLPEPSWWWRLVHD